MGRERSVPAATTDALLSGALFYYFDFFSSDTCAVLYYQSRLFSPRHSRPEPNRQFYWIVADDSPLGFA
jgi:hypothetical protein